MRKANKSSEFALMNHPIPKRFIINLLLIVLWSSGCSAPGTQSPPLSFVGSLIISSGDNIYEITSDSAKKK